MDKRIVNYCLKTKDTLIKDDPKTIAMVVTELIEDGWQPFGSPFVDEDGQDCQAMVKYE
tara:strand:+ start:1095 stop:1271 length:177 start_codon:yes stop_codon:yes gene_type:complete